MVLWQSGGVTTVDIIVAVLIIAALIVMVTAG